MSMCSSENLCVSVMGRNQVLSESFFNIERSDFLILYTGARDAILGSAEDLPTNVSGALLGATNPHNEDLLDVR